MKFLILTLLQVLNVYGADFSWTDCTAADSPLKVTNVAISPHPIVLPGNLELTLDGASTAPLGSSTLQVSMKRKTFLGEIGIPCILNVGSCTYNDICTLVDRMESENWAGVMGQIGTEIRAMLKTSGVDASMCPQPVQTLHIDHQSIHLPEVPAVLSLFAAGDYHVHVSVTENSLKKEILCMDFQVTMTEACSGFSCIFG